MPTSRRVRCAVCTETGYIGAGFNTPRYWTKGSAGGFLCGRCGRDYRPRHHGERASCAECGKTARIEGYRDRPKYWSWVTPAPGSPLSDRLLLCRSCAPRVRGQRRRAPVELDEPGLVVTKAVEGIVTAQARDEVPIAPRLKKAESSSGLIVSLAVVSLVGALVALFAGVPILFVVGLIASLLLLFVVSPLHNRIAIEPAYQERAGEIRSKTQSLARERQEAIDERERFYSSSEWLSLRDQAIREYGRTCAMCGRALRRDSELTVDHIKPRSRFPELSLERSNLQVLCRSCNSSKGARLLE